MNYYRESTKQNSSDRLLNQAYRDIVIILLLGLFIYLPFLGSLQWSGNESLRVIVTREIVETNNWIMTTMHGKPYFIKPPLFNWLIALSGKLFGTINEWTSRLPSVVAMVFTGLAVYFLSGQALSRNGRFFAALATMSMTGLIKKARTAEIDSLFIFFVTLSLLIWIYGYIKKYRPLVTWSIPLAILGIGFLTKGPHAATFFYFTVFAFLLIRKDLRYFFSVAHLGGLIIMLAIIAAYVLAVLQHISWQEYAGIWTHQFNSRAETREAHVLIKHLIDFPLYAPLSFAPWILLFIPVFVSRNLRGIFRGLLKNDLILFSSVMVVANFPLYWILPNAFVRYYLPAGPFFAIILAGVVEHYFSEREQKSTSIGITLRKLAIIASLGIGICFHIYTAAMIHREARDINSPKKIAAEIERAVPSDVNAIYVLKRFEEVTCYMKRNVIRANTFHDLQQLREKGQEVYFMFDNDKIFSSIEAEKWEKVYYRKIKKEELIVGRLVVAPKALQ